ncbi:MAG: YraN family protein, partial [Aeromicrobium sp.]|nr:YraN family protein [Burkholderiales bacterium]
MTPPHSLDAKTSGDDAERIAERYLTQRGLKLVARNYHCRYGEIDLIMRHADSLVFVEVKLRKTPSGRVNFGGALASITPSKQAKLIATAQHYLAGLKQLPPCRFDAVLLNGLTMKDVEWLR